MLLLEPYIIYTQVNEPPSTQTQNTQQLAKPKTLQPEFQIEINHADTAVWTVLNGIGPAYANRIVQYRTLLGGF